MASSELSSGEEGSVKRVLSQASRSTEHFDSFKEALKITLMLAVPPLFSQSVLQIAVTLQY